MALEGVSAKVVTFDANKGGGGVLKLGVLRVVLRGGVLKLFGLR